MNFKNPVARPDIYQIGAPLFEKGGILRFEMSKDPGQVKKSINIIKG